MNCLTLINQKIRFPSPKGGQKILSTYKYCININTCFIHNSPHPPHSLGAVVQKYLIAWHGVISILH